MLPHPTPNSTSTRNPKPQHPLSTTPQHPLYPNTPQHPNTPKTPTPLPPPGAQVLQVHPRHLHPLPGAGAGGALLGGRRERAPLHAAVRARGWVGWVGVGVAGWGWGGVGLGGRGIDLLPSKITQHTSASMLGCVSLQTQCTRTRGYTQLLTQISPNPSHVLQPPPTRATPAPASRWCLRTMTRCRMRCAALSDL